MGRKKKNDYQKIFFDKKVYQIFKHIIMGNNRTSIIFKKSEDIHSDGQVTKLRDKLGNRIIIFEGNKMDIFWPVICRDLIDQTNNIRYSVDKPKVKITLSEDFNIKQIISHVKETFSGIIQDDKNNKIVNLSDLYNQYITFLITKGKQIKLKNPKLKKWINLITLSDIDHTNLLFIKHITYPPT